MMVSRRQARTNRRKALAATWSAMTTVAKIRKLYSSGRPRKLDQKISPITAYGQAGVYLEKIQLDMTMAGLDPNDVSVFLFVQETAADFTAQTSFSDFATAVPSDFTAAVPFPVSRATMDLTIPQLLEFKNALPVCVVVQILDREETRPEHKYKRWIAPFVTGVDPDAIIAQILSHMERGIPESN
jgi:hypothetical protein